VDRFLVADEAGLGKTMVAKGLIALAIDHLWQPGKRIDILYVCSNQQIARQNLSRLNIVGGQQQDTPDRLPLLGKSIRNLRSDGVNFLAFTPKTSLQMRDGGRYDERVMLYWMLARAWKGQVSNDPRWANFFRIGMGLKAFGDELSWFDQSSIDDEMCQAFGAAVKDPSTSKGSLLGHELEACVEQFDPTAEPTPELNGRRIQLVAQLRRLVAHAAVQELKPGLVILDEFQRFRELLDPEADDEGARLAQALIFRPNAKVLFLSATPYKMLTLPDEPEGDEHHRDFTATLRILADEERARSVAGDLSELRRTLRRGGDLGPALKAKQRAESEMLRVMCRTERLAQARHHDGMVEERALPGVKLVPEDLHAWRTLDGLAQVVGGRDVFEYWRSTPYPLNLMDRDGYQIRGLLDKERDNPKVAVALASARGLLDCDSIRTYQPVEPGNPKMRGLVKDVLEERGAWRLAWLPPSLHYYELGGAYADPKLQSFTKRLVFSQWAVVPKAIAVILSYDAERRAAEAAGLTERTHEEPPLQFRMESGRARDQDMNTLALVFPSIVLARIGDPLEIAKSTCMDSPNRKEPVNRDELLAVVREKVREKLSALPDGDPPNSDVEDPRWYWAAPFLLDRRLEGVDNAAFFTLMRDLVDSGKEEEDSRLDMHLETAREVNKLVLDHRRDDSGFRRLGTRPADLDVVLAQMAVVGPGVCALRALSRVTGGVQALARTDIRRAAYLIAHGLRALFNKREIVTLLRSEPRLVGLQSKQQRELYWRAVLDHGLDGCLQSVLDEYAHVLIESEGLQDADRTERAKTLSDTIRAAIRTHLGSFTVSDIRVIDGQIPVGDDVHLTPHMAAQFNKTQSADTGASIRTAYNSPFRPFVLASTSIGQEGLDFHTYSHSIVHWNLPANPVDLEQREGRVHRYKGHAVRKNLARDYFRAALQEVYTPNHEHACEPDSDDTWRERADPWAAMFEVAHDALGQDSDDIEPFWIYSPANGAVIERYVPALPLSRETQHYDRLERTLGVYRMSMGQPRQADFIRYVGKLGIDPAEVTLSLSPSRPGLRDDPRSVSR
jgi:Helicase conserved C-terminal domain